MDKILENIKDFLFFITHPNYWCMADGLSYSEKYDKMFNTLLKTHEFTDYSHYTIKLGNTMFWVTNTPYSCFYTVTKDKYEINPVYGTLRPSRRTIHKAIKKLNNYLEKVELDKMKTQ